MHKKEAEFEVAQQYTVVQPGHGPDPRNSASRTFFRCQSDIGRAPEMSQLSSKHPHFLTHSCHFNHEKRNIHATFTLSQLISPGSVIRSAYVDDRIIESRFKNKNTTLSETVRILLSF